MSHIARKGIHRSALIPECQAEGQISFARALVRKAELVLVVSVAWKAEVAVEANLAVHTSRASLAYTEFPARTRLGPLSRHRIKTRIWTKLPSPTFMLRQIQSWSLNSTAAAEPMDTDEGPVGTQGDSADMSAEVTTAPATPLMAQADDGGQNDGLAAEGGQVESGQNAGAEHVDTV